MSKTKATKATTVAPTTTTVTTAPTTLGIFASIKYVIVTLCSMLVKAIGEADGTLDIISDVRLTAKTYSDQLYQEAIITSKQQIKELQNT